MFILGPIADMVWICRLEICICIFCLIEAGWRIYASLSYTIVGSDKGLAIIWPNAGLLSIWPFGTNFNEITIKIRKFSFKKMHLKISSVKFSNGLLTVLWQRGYVVP